MNVYIFFPDQEYWKTNRTEKDYKKFFTNGSIYNDWIGSVSEMHELID